MKIYLVVKDSKRINQFVPELVLALKSAGHYVDCGLSILWSDDVVQYDVVYFQWPEFSLPSPIVDDDVVRLERRILFLRKNGVLVVSQCHNLRPHDARKIIENRLYKIVYGNCDVIVHMGNCSKEMLKCDYPNAEHIVVPHHIYDHTYLFNYDSLTCKKKLGCDVNKKMILCFGTFRNENERNLIFNLKEKLDMNEYQVVAPGFFQGKIIKRNIIEGFLNLLKAIKFRCKGMKFSLNPVSDDKMQLYFCAADLVLIQRPYILNSGNLPMGFAAGKVVVGPDVGNVGEILKKTGNPVFDATSIKSLIVSIKQGIVLSQNGLGQKNREYAYRKWNTEFVGKLLSAELKKYLCLKRRGC